MRAEKRKKNAPKELERLKKILGTNADVVMEEVKEVATVLPPKKVLEQGGEWGSRWAVLGLRGGPAGKPDHPRGRPRCPRRLSRGPGLPETCRLSARLPFLPAPPPRTRF